MTSTFSNGHLPDLNASVSRTVSEGLAFGLVQQPGSHLISAPSRGRALGKTGEEGGGVCANLHPRLAGVWLQD